MALKDGIKKLSDDALEEVVGGAATARHSNEDLKKAGIEVKNVNGKTTYVISLSNGTKKTVTDVNVAMGACDCYNIAGCQYMSPAELDALIAQTC